MYVHVYVCMTENVLLLLLCVEDHSHLAGCYSLSVAGDSEVNESLKDSRHACADAAAALSRCTPVYHSVCFICLSLL